MSQTGRRGDSRTDADVEWFGSVLRRTFLEMSEAGFVVDGSGVPDYVAAHELVELSAGLLVERKTFVFLRDKYKIQISLLLILLAHHRIAWRLSNRAPLFANWSREELERMSQRLADTARAVVEAEAFLTDYSRYLWHVAHEAGDPPPWLSDDEAPIVLKDVRSGAPTVGFRWSAHFEEVRRTLQDAQAGLATVDWGTVGDASGKLHFGPGVRANRTHEAEAAHHLVVFFRRETGRALYDHVGRLLAATFPSLNEWLQPGEHRLRDYVKQLLDQYPAQAGASG